MKGEGLVQEFGCGWEDGQSLGCEATGGEGSTQLGKALTHIIRA